MNETFSTTGRYFQVTPSEPVASLSEAKYHVNKKADCNCYLPIPVLPKF